MAGFADDEHWFEPMNEHGETIEEELERKSRGLCHHREPLGNCKQCNPVTMNERLKKALKQAIIEIREHNAEYHHHTSEETLTEWDKLLGRN